MERISKNALELATFLSQHPKIQAVHYPGLTTHPQHSLAKGQMKRGFGGMISFEVKGGKEAGRVLIENLKVVTLAVSLGGVESLVEQASTMTHTMIGREEREKAGIADGLIRFSVGIESVNDLLKDLQHALDLVVID